MSRGLASLLNVNQINLPENSPSDIEIILIDANPYQPRRRFDREQILELAESIKKHGVLQPVLLRKKDGGRYELIAGERRLRASKEAGLRSIPAIIRDVTDTQSLELAIIENVQREDIGPIETAMAYRRLTEEFGYTQETLAGAVGKSRSAISNLMRLLSLPEPVLELLEGKAISEGHARAILSVSEENRIPFAERIVGENLTVRDAEALAWVINNPLGDMSEAEASKPKSVVSRETKERVGEAGRLAEALQARVKVLERKAGGRIVIEFKSEKDLERIVSQILGEAK
ncbi:MAG: ParB/RepB/Spo0J family partition protein [Abditibacteriota bacterium]|nr:ParB/RepB/Spo0J family partition protein [Abditibacteriota bacterium]